MAQYGLTPAGRAAVIARYAHAEQGGLGGGNAGPHHWVSREELHRLLDEAGQEGLAADAAAEGLVESILDGFFRSRGGGYEHVLVETTPRHRYFASRILRRWPEARIVEVLRDGRDLCVSLEHRAKAGVMRSHGPHGPD
ncbi:MAG: sulfotransferase [Actinobacteria bacterium]|nr:sulfotransferase [Actinomycetota bacterium]MBW3648956.1 sulfotransferase [Actinomycetota bacterium]